MARMMVWERKNTFFYPNGLDHPYLCAGLNRYGIIMRAIRLWCAGGHAQLLIDEGGEFQIWGRRASDPAGGPYFRHEVYRENSAPAWLTGIFRAVFNRWAEFFTARLP